MTWSPLLIAALAGMAAGAIMAFFSHIAPRFGAGNFIQDVDKPHVFGRGISRRESHLIGIFIHLLLSGAFGFGFAVLVEYGQIAGYYYLPMLLWCVAISLFLGLVVMPIEGHGVFGRKHDPWFMVDALLTNFFWGHLFLVLMRLWLVA